jgi:hypothetical protein
MRRWLKRNPFGNPREKGRFAKKNARAARAAFFFGVCGSLSADRSLSAKA